MTLNTQQLRRASAAPREPDAGPALARPPANLDVLMIGAGNSGESVALGCQALGIHDRVWIPAIGLNNDRLPPRLIAVPQADRGSAALELADRLVLDGENPRERLLDEPLLAQRYRPLLRGLPVLETYPRAGAGGHGHPAIAALDIDLSINLVLSWLRGGIHQLRGAPHASTGQTELQRRLAAWRQHDDTTRELRVVLIGGAAGAMGNASHQLLPYLVRHVLAEQGITRYELWGVLLGPRAFSGLTPYTRQNFRALLEGIEQLSRHGMRRRFINDLEIAMQQPPYDRVFLLDDPRLPGTAAKVTEQELDVFLSQSALSLYTLLRGTVWPTVASHTANDDGVARADGRLRYLHTARAVVLRADREQLRAELEQRLAQRALSHFIERFAA